MLAISGTCVYYVVIHLVHINTQSIHLHDLLLGDVLFKRRIRVYGKVLVLH